MTEFYQEITPGGYGIAIKRKNTLFCEQSPFQKVEVFESDSTLGRVLTLDDLMMTTEGDEYHYHEMIAHVPMMNHKNPESVLVIGGGDGGTVREVLKHKSVKRVVLCEIDGMVIDVCKKYLPTIACELENPKVEILVQDAIEYIKDKKNEFDIYTQTHPDAQHISRKDFRRMPSERLNLQKMMKITLENVYAICDVVEFPFDKVHIYQNYLIPDVYISGKLILFHKLRYTLFVLRRHRNSTLLSRYFSNATSLYFL